MSIYTCTTNNGADDILEIEGIQFKFLFKNLNN